MSKVQYGVVCGLLAAIVGVEAAPLLMPPKSPPPTFEYKIIAIPDLSFGDQMESFGKAGWELVFARRASGEDDKMSYEMILKRVRIAD